MSDGMLRPCLGDNREVSLKEALGESTDDALLRVIREAIYGKPVGHTFGEGFTPSKAWTESEGNMARIVSINLSDKKGTIKRPAELGVLIEEFGFEGDAHAGKWHRQVSLLAQESIDKMIALGLNDLTPGIFAENITTEGIELYTLPVGTRLKLGEALAEVTQIGKECHHHCEVFNAWANA